MRNRRPGCQVFRKVIFDCSSDAEGDRAGPRSRVFLGGARHAAHHRNVFDTTRNKVFIELDSKRERERECVCVCEDRNQQPLASLAGESRSVYGIV